MSTIRVLSKQHVETLLPISTAVEVVDLMAKVFCTFSNDTSQMESPQRISVTNDNHRVLFMPSRLRDTTSIKVVSVPLGNSKGGLPASILVLDSETSRAEAIMNADVLTAVRTAAGSALATRYYADPDSTHLVIFGAGAQARYHAIMMLAVVPSIKRIAIWNRGMERRDALIRDLADLFPQCEVAPAVNLPEELAKADIVCTCTNASEPVLQGRYLKSSVHLNCVGSYRLDMFEIDSDAVNRANCIIVDSVEACKHEAGELVSSMHAPDSWVEIGNVVQEPELQQQAKDNRPKITLFKSVGISVQDSAIAGLIAERAKAADIGVVTPF